MGCQMKIFILNYPICMYIIHTSYYYKIRPSLIQVDTYFEYIYVNNINVLSKVGQGEYIAC